MKTQWQVISFRRSQHHMRMNKARVHVLWFVRHGELKISRSRGTHVARAGECLILNSNEPFHLRAEIEDGNFFDATLAIVPSYLFISHLNSAIRFIAPFPITTRDCKCIARLLDLLFFEGDYLGESAAQNLVAGFLEVVADSLKHRIKDLSRDLHRLIKAEAFIANNFSNPDITFDQVASCCGISPRYLCQIFESNNKSYSRLLWRHRIAESRNILGSKIFHKHTIEQIAFTVGFKNTSHFIRRFKATYGASPKRYKALLAEGLA